MTTKTTQATSAAKDTRAERIAATFAAVQEFALPNLGSATTKLDLRREAEAEAGTTAALLLDEHGLTNGMRAACVAPVIDTIGEFDRRISAFEAAIKPLLPEIESLENLGAEIEELKQQARETEERIEEKYRADAKYAQAVVAMEHTKELYDEKYNEHGQREPKDFRTWAYLMLLVGIGCVEWLVNYSAFLANFGAPAMSAGFTIIVALVVAAASHEHGTLIKQREHHFGAHVDGKRKLWKLIWVGLVTLGLAAALIFVGWNRYNWAIEIIAKMDGGSVVIGGSAGMPQIDVNQKVLMSIIANLLVWLLGAAIAYWAHDYDPEFTDRWRRMRKANAAYLSWRKKVDAEIHTARAKLIKNIDAKKNTAKALSQRTRDLSEMRDEVYSRQTALSAEAEALINSMIRSYRTALSTVVREGNKALSFSHNGAIIDLETYLQMPASFALTTSPSEGKKEAVA